MVNYEHDEDSHDFTVESSTVVGSLVALMAVYEVVALTINRILDEPVLPSFLILVRRVNPFGKLKRRSST